VKKACRKAERSVPGISMVLQRRIHLRQERLDLLSLLSVQRLCKRLRDTTPKLDVIICNAGIGGWTTLNWGRAVWTILTGLKQALTYPTFKISGKGWVAKPQIPSQGDGKTADEPELGEVFCANFFGHYLLGHYLAPLLARRHDDEEHTRGRLIWISSLEAYEHCLDLDDIQAIKSDVPYEASKRLTDLAGITSTLPSPAPFVDAYLSAGKTDSPAKPARIYVTHPGICGTSIFALPFVLECAMFLVMYAARWLGSQWHPVTVEKGATAMVWLALAKQSTLDDMEEREGVGKWGSATDWWGEERVERTEVEGWGWGGKLGEVKRKGRSPFAGDLTEVWRKRFEADGRRAWEKLEGLRIEWEQRLEDAGVAVPME
jgi:3-keto steroid reductase